MKISNPRLKIAITATILGGGLTASTAQAELITYDLQWSGLEFGNAASATGQVTLDTNLVPNPGFYLGQWAGSGFSNFSITVTGALTGNGTFSTANGDFADVIWNIGQGGPGLGGGGDPVDPIDLHTELMGQLGFSDFNVFSNFDGGEPAGPGGDPTAPNGWAPFVLETGGFVDLLGGGPGSGGDLIELVSMRPVPAPSSIALLGLTALATTRRRR